mmetsp:Transcript_1270/g.1704  ORF Transcript_1270/g.1704 Transcript_1270/m.1704 type:complete len:131 (-) Transcript_1270:357-749(-)
MGFDYLVIIDYQVTSGADADEANEQEIFEFPWVVFDVASKHVVDEKAVYVKPTLHEKLGADCAKAALGDDASSMESAGSLQQAVQEFNDYVYRSFIANNKDFCILTVSELPIKRWLWGEGNMWCRVFGSG